MHSSCRPSKRPDTDTQECAAATVGNFAASNRLFEPRDGGREQILGFVLEAIPRLLGHCSKVKAGFD